MRNLGEFPGVENILRRIYERMGFKIDFKLIFKFILKLKKAKLK